MHSLSADRGCHGLGQPRNLLAPNGEVRSVRGMAEAVTTLPRWLSKDSGRSGPVAGSGVVWRVVCCGVSQLTHLFARPEQQATPFPALLYHPVINPAVRRAAIPSSQPDFLTSTQGPTQ